MMNIGLLFWSCLTYQSRFVKREQEGEEEAYDNNVKSQGDGISLKSWWWKDLIDFVLCKYQRCFFPPLTCCTSVIFWKVLIDLTISSFVPVSFSQFFSTKFKKLSTLAVFINSLIFCDLDVSFPLLCKNGILQWSVRQVHYLSWTLVLLDLSKTFERVNIISFLKLVLSVSS